jgi:hypothetical protein
MIAGMNPDCIGSIRNLAPELVAAPEQAILQSLQ